MQIPDCLGLTIEDASQLLQSWGISYCEEIIRPFFKGEPKAGVDGPLRVIGQKEVSGRAVLTVCSVPLEGDEHVRKQ
ncbi:MAG: hypothetical protein HUJ80_07965 [Firmicutes bacterium]|nr:hypothetical protein [Bacillota bacterium]